MRACSRCIVEMMANKAMGLRGFHIVQPVIQKQSLALGKAKTLPRQVVNGRIRLHQAFFARHDDVAEAIKKLRGNADLLQGDGNKRTAFIAVELFLELNEFELSASDADCVLTMLAVAAGQMDERTFAGWLRQHSQPQLR